MVSQRCRHFHPLPTRSSVRTSLRVASNLVSPNQLRSLNVGSSDVPYPVSAELEITVPLLIQIDKLVQLLESPVFTGLSAILSVIPSSQLTLRAHSSPSPTIARAGEASLLAQGSLRPPHVTPSIECFRYPTKSSQCSQLAWFPSNCPEVSLLSHQHSAFFADW